MVTPELSVYIRERRIGRRRERRIRKLEKKLVNIIFTQTFNPPDTDKITTWAEETLATFNSLPKGNSAERRNARNLVTQTAKRLLESPQDISIAEKVWGTNGTEQDESQKPQEPLSELVRKECVSLIKDKWEDVKPGQLAQLVRIYANKDKSQESIRESAEDLLRSYFKGPKSRNQRIDAYYNFVSGILDLAEEGETFKEGMKIALHATDVLPKNPSLVEQVVLVSLPYKEDGVFQKAIIANYIICQLRFMGLQDFNFTNYYDDRNTFARKGIAVRQEMRKKEQRMVKEIELDEIRRLNSAAQSFFYSLIEPLSEERKQTLMGIWPYNLAFDPRDLLNQKFQEVISQKDKSFSRTAK